MYCHILAHPPASPQAVSQEVRNRPTVFIDHVNESEKFIFLENILQSHLGYQESDILTLKKCAVTHFDASSNIITLLEKSQRVIVVISKNYSAPHIVPEILLIGKAITSIIIIIGDDGTTDNDIPDDFSKFASLSYDDVKFIEKLEQFLT